MTKKVGIKSDYFDYYDVYFDLGAVEAVFERNAVASWGTPRQKMFQYFHRLNLDTPAFGRFSYLTTHKKHIKQLVVYTDPVAHCGEGKRLVTVDELSEDEKRQYHDLYASEYVAEHYGESFRLLHIGDAEIWFKHVSFEDWRSNHGDGELIYQWEKSLTLPSVAGIANPVWAIDFVQAGDKLLAIDLNTAPKGATTGIHEKLRGQHAYEIIRDFVLVEKQRANIAVATPFVFNNNNIRLH